MSLTELSDDELVSRISAICFEGYRLTARLLVHLIEVEERRLHLRAACSSMFDFCIRKLGMSEGAAYRRINGARMARKFPALLSRIERGELCLSTLVLLRPHLTEANVEELVTAVCGKTQRAVEEHLARIAPKPDAPTMIVPIPRTPMQGEIVTASERAGATTFMHLPEAPSSPSRIEPLSEARFKVQLTASTKLRDKLERARDLMRHRNPNGDLAVVVDAAVDALLEKLERERLGKATRARRTARSTKPGRVSTAVRREVFARDGERCTFRGEDGERCPARGFLEVDHIEPRALGGADEANNLRVRCRAHNLLYAEQVFGQEHMARATSMDLRQRKSQPVAQDGRDGRDETRSKEIERAVSALAGMGFNKSDARRALGVVTAKHAADRTDVPLPELVRDAITLLT
jgi:hypothetical protein